MELARRNETVYPLSEQAQSEIVRSQRCIAEAIDRPVDTFAYPDGRRANITDSIKAVLREHGFVCAVYGNPDALVCPGTDPYEMGRLSPRWDFSTFHLTVCGLYPDLMALRGREGEMNGTAPKWFTRAYRQGDEEGIFDLWKAVYPEKAYD